jgi:DNA-binding NarL/FixJ family response regulator
MSGNLRIAATVAGADLHGAGRSGLVRQAHAGRRNRMAGAATGSMPQTLTFIVIDRRVLIRECLARCLMSFGDNCCVLDYATVTEWQEAAANQPSAAVIVLCAHQGRESETERDLSMLAQHATSIPVVVLADTESADHILTALEGGARGYIPTSMSLEVAVRAMCLVEAGGTFVPVSTIFSSRHTEEVSHKSGAPSGGLTARQAAVVDALRLGKANKQIAYELNMREGTVKVHVRNIMKKLNARNRTEVAVLASIAVPNIGAS